MKNNTHDNDPAVGREMLQTLALRVAVLEAQVKHLSAQASPRPGTLKAQTYGSRLS